MAGNQTSQGCASFACAKLPDPRDFGVFLFYCSTFCTGTCALNIYLTISRKLHLEFPIFIVLASQTLADLCNSSFYIYGSVTLLAQTPLPNLRAAVWIGYLEPFFYGTQLAQHVSVSFSRFLSVVYVRYYSRPFSNRKALYALSLCPWLANLGIYLTIYMHVLGGGAAGYFHPEYAYIYFTNDEKLDFAFYERFWRFYEIGCISTALCFYVIAWVLLKGLYRVTPGLGSRGRDRRAGEDSSSSEPTEQQRTGMDVSESHKRMERNLFIFCTLNTTVAGINCFTWRYVGFLFAITDLLNSVTGSILAFTFINKVRRELIKFSTWQTPGTEQTRSFVH